MSVITASTTVETSGMSKQRLERKSLRSSESTGTVQYQKAKRSKTFTAAPFPTTKSTLLKDLQAGENVLIVAHRNVLQVLMKHLDKVPDDESHEFCRKLRPCACYIYRINKDGQVTDKTIRN